MRTARQAIQQTTPRETAIATVSAAVVTLHEHDLTTRPDWFWTILHRAERKAAKMADAAAAAPYSLGQVTFIQVFAQQLPMMVAAALERLDEPAS